jgi:hypothetical protein
MMMMLCSRWAVAVLPAQSRARASLNTPVVHRLAIPEPIILVQVCSQRPGQPRSRGRDDTSKRNVNVMGVVGEERKESMIVGDRSTIGTGFFFTSLLLSW